MPTIRFRILSDLHYGEPASRVSHLSMVRPLFDGPEALILNGDSLDTRFLDLDPDYAEAHEAFFQFVQPWRERLTLITGNHDPNISEHHHLELERGSVLLTHGDVLFPAVAPWGWEAPHVIAARERRLAEITADQHERFETQLEICKHTSYATRHLSPSFGTQGGYLRQLRRLLSRIRRVDRIFSSWYHAPALAAGLASRFRPTAKVVVFGHTHYPGVWERSGRLVINTGAFTPPFAPRLVDVTEDAIEVRRIVCRNGEFKPGPLLRRIPTPGP